MSARNYSHLLREVFRKGSGRLIVSFLSEIIRVRVFSKYPLRIGPFATIFRLLDRAKELGYFTDYVISGRLAAMNYTEPVYAHGADFLVNAEVIMRDLDAFLLDSGAIRDDRGYFEIDGMPCKFHAAGDDLTREAFAHPHTVPVGRRKIKVLKIEYLIADYIGLMRLQEHKKKSISELLWLFTQRQKINETLLDQILIKHDLKNDFIAFKQWMDSD